MSLIENLMYLRRREIKNQIGIQTEVISKENLKILNFLKKYHVII